MVSLSRFEPFLETIGKLFKDKGFEDLFFFVYTDDIGWGFETYPTTLEDKETMYTASMWWNIAMNDAHAIGVGQKDLKFYCIHSPLEFLKDPESSLREIKELSDSLESSLNDNEFFKLKKKTYEYAVPKSIHPTIHKSIS